jgi:hypothetical protein
MANATDINCTDNYSLPTGPRGDRGSVGATGATGPQGVQGATGPQGNSGASKIDLTFINNNLPYKEVSSTSYQEVAYFIFGGTASFGTPTSIRVGYSGIAYSTPNSPDLNGVTESAMSFLVEDVTDPNNPAQIAREQVTFTDSTHVPRILLDSTLTNLPTNSAVFKLSVRQEFLDKQAKPFRVYALELK